MLGALRRWGASPAAGVTAAAIRRGDQVAVIDELGSLTFGELEQRSNALARALAERGVKGGDSVALMCRNHRGFVDSLFACSKLGATVLLMNTDFAGPQLEGVIEREEPQVLIYDPEFTELLEKAAGDLERVVSWIDEGEQTEHRTIEQEIEANFERSTRSSRRDEPLHRLHIRHDRHAEGRPAQLARFARPARGPALEDPATAASRRR